MAMHIRTEKDAWEFLNACLADPAHGSDRYVKFDGLMLKIRLEPGDGRADYRAQRAFALLQTHMNLTYQMAKRGHITGRLSDYERAMLSVDLAVMSGSTILEARCAKAFQTILAALPSHYSTRTKNILAVGIALATVAVPVATIALPVATYFGSVHSATIASEAQVKSAQITADAALEATDRNNRANLEIANIQAKAQVEAARAGREDAVAEANSPFFGMPGAVMLAQLTRDDTSNLVAFAVSDYVPWRPAILTLAPLGGTITWNDGAQISARAAKAVATATRKEATKQRRVAKLEGRPKLIETPWVTEVLRYHSAPGAMRLGISDA
jgi:cell division septum initiation protein DivIVA